MNPIIRVEKLSKVYRIGAGMHAGYRTLRESIAHAARAPLRRVAGLAGRLSPRLTRTPASAAATELWALRDVSFDVGAGEVVGIVGHNGAGKSTLLKIFSRITEPTSGRATLRGRVGSLLEVGTGFHPELTGRENIYLNGAVLGMTRSEIRRKFDAIVAFAEIARFLDTPVKRYSSGMYVRLAFAVAAHLEPEVLLVDEVLAVGDLAFQNKCLNHMRSLTRSGTTILLVSHNMAAIQSSCRRALLLDRGMLSADGPPAAIIDRYREMVHVQNCDPEGGRRRGESEPTASPVAIRGFQILDSAGAPTREFRFGDCPQIRIELDAAQRIERPVINFGIRRSDGVLMCNFNNWYDGFALDYLEGHCTLEGWLPSLRFTPDFYEIHVLVWPSGGWHAPDMAGARPLAAVTFGDFRISGPPLNTHHDGALQLPAQRWRFRRHDCETVHDDISPQSLRLSFERSEKAKRTDSGMGD
jgi:lipopolysaccharide transport system ATP-binding protein